MRNNLTRLTVRFTVTAAAAGGLVFAPAVPAFASGQAYQAPGFTSPNASCMGTAYDFGAHYGESGESFPDFTHGAIGPSISEHATSDGPGAVGEFSATLAQSHGAVWDCLS
jgi:hypothetical protein